MCTLAASPFARPALANGCIAARSSQFTRCWRTGHATLCCCGRPAVLGGEVGRGVDGRQEVAARPPRRSKAVRAEAKVPSNGTDILFWQSTARAH